MSEAVLLVLADEYDPAAAAFVERHAAAGACLLRPADLSWAGWSYRVGDPHGSVAVAGGISYPAQRIRGVLTRLPVISGAHLPHVSDQDRDYVAAEMSAFLLAWLSALPCPVLNRPRAPSLAGPGWRWEQWARLARELEVPVAPVQREVRRGGAPGREPSGVASSENPTCLSVVGSTIIGPQHPQLVRHARRLSEAAGVALLGLIFDGDHDTARLTGIEPWPDIGEPVIAAAVMDHLQ